MNNNIFIDSFFSKKSYWVQFLYLLLFIVGGLTLFSVLGTGLVMIIYGGAPDSLAHTESASAYRLLQFISTIGTFAIPALLFAYCKHKKWFSYNSMNQMPNYLMMDVVIVLSIVLMPVILGLAQWNEMMHLPESFSGVEQWMLEAEEKASQLISLITRDSRIGILLLNLLILAVLPAVCEELLFRGTIQTFLFQWTKNKHLAIWITAFIFSAIHLQFYGFIPRFLLGAYLGYLLVWSGSLWLPILAHFLNNALSIIAEFILLKRGIMVDDIEATDISGFIPIFITSVILAIVGLIFLLKMKKEAVIPKD